MLLFRPWGRSRVFRDLIRTARRAESLLEPGSAERIGSFLDACRAPGGGFRGRGTAADTYYSLFAVACRAALSLKPTDADLPTGLTGETLPNDLVHASAALVAASLARTPRSVLRRHAPGIEAFRAGDGGYGVHPGAAAGTAYGAYLALLAYDAMGMRPPGIRGLADGMERLRASDGGYANEAGQGSGQVPATVSALVVRAFAARRPDEAALEFLTRMADPAGGFRAGADAPVPDLLSTGVALYALRRFRRLPRAGRAATARFVASLWHDSGGFGGTAADDGADCEYTFYALLSLGVLGS